MNCQFTTNLNKIWTTQPIEDRLTLEILLPTQSLQGPKQMGIYNQEASLNTWAAENPEAGGRHRLITWMVSSGAGIQCLRWYWILLPNSCRQDRLSSAGMPTAYFIKMQRK